MDVRPGRLDVAEQLVLPDVLPVLNGRDHVPVAERPRPAGADDALAVDGPRLDGVHGLAVPPDDVDAEVEGPRAAGDAWVVEVTADGMRAVKRLQRPAVRHRGEPRSLGRGAQAARLRCLLRAPWPSG